MLNVWLQQHLEAEATKGEEDLTMSCCQQVELHYSKQLLPFCLEEAKTTFALNGVKCFKGYLLALQNMSKVVKILSVDRLQLIKYRKKVCVKSWKSGSGGFPPPIGRHEGAFCSPISWLRNSLFPSAVTAVTRTISAPLAAGFYLVLLLYFFWSLYSIIYHTPNVSQLYYVCLNLQCVCLFVLNTVYILIVNWTDTYFSQLMNGMLCDKRLVRIKKLPLSLFFFKCQNLKILLPLSVSVWHFIMYLPTCLLQRWKAVRSSRP